MNYSASAQGEESEGAPFSARRDRKKMQISDDYVRMAKCRMCGKHSGAILIHKQLRSIPEDQAWDPEPCGDCVKRLETMVYFSAECGHAGFVKDSIITDRVSPIDLAEAILKRRMVGMEKCFICIDGRNVKEFETV
jgi:hypothetical protein